MTWNRLRFKKIRILLAWIGCAALFLNAKTNDSSFRIGVPIVIGGELIRIWALGYLEQKGKVLATNGPFSYVRNPLYIGNFFIGLGVTIISYQWLFLVLFLIGFFVIYQGVVQNEEKELATRFGGSYVDYRKKVGAFLPRWAPFSGRGRTRFELKRLWKHHEHITVIGIALLVAALYLWEEIILQGDFKWKEKIAIGFIMALLTVIIYELAAKTRRSLTAVMI